MAVPKRKTSKAKTRSRRAAQLALGASGPQRLPQCSTSKLPHVVCPNCGWYKGRVAVEVN